jgi:hypothetical protein
MDIGKLEAGPELDALVAEKVMGWRYAVTDERQRVARKEYHWFLDETGFGHLGFKPSTDIASAWLVFMHFPETYKGLTHTQRNSLGWTLGQPLEWHCWIGATNNVVADTAPIAICRAALKAVQP